MKIWALLLAFGMVATGFAQTGSPAVQLVNPSSVAAPKGYSHAAVIDLGNYKMVILSGQVAFDKGGNLVGKDNLEKQTAQVFRNIKNIVEELGGSMEHVVKTPPASTLVQVSKLFRDDILIEIEATAIIPKK